MSWREEVAEINRRRAFAEALGGKESVDRQHAAGRLTVRERIAKLVDKDSFHELGVMAGKATYDENHNLVSVRPSNAVIGTGRITWMNGSSEAETRRDQPIMIPSGIPTRMARLNPFATRMVENRTLSHHVPE